MKRLLSILAFVFITGTSSGQDYTFKVLANRGENKLKRASGKKVPLKTGDELYDKDIIITDSDAYVGLMHHSGRTTELRGKQKVRVREIALPWLSGVPFDGQRGIIAADKSDDGSELVVLLPMRSTDLYGDRAVVRWLPRDSKKGQKYTVTIKNIFDDDLLTVETDQTFIPLNLREIKNESGLYIFRVSENRKYGFISGDYGIKKLSDWDMPDVKGQLQSLLSELGENAPADKIRLAEFYEKNGLLLDAITQYEQALQLAPDLETTRKQYNDFLARHDLAVFEE